MNIPRPQAPSLTYRPDVDGLRAVAVLAVILFHIDSDLMPGGYVGVDIFFVISGYLISLQIYRELENGTFSLLEFYRRRVKRIAPALLVVIAVTLVVTQFVYRPPDAESVAKSAWWSLFSVANIHFWWTSNLGYFAADVFDRPLLHLWSLGVEEQFYLLWPLALLLLYRRCSSATFVLLLLAVAAASTVFAQAYHAVDPGFVYYMLPARVGELLIGALAAHWVLRHGERRIAAGVVVAASVSGVALIGASLILLTEDSTFPGLLALPPTIGTALLIVAGHYGRAWPSRVLRVRPLVWTGKVSYSAYLWHWPLLVLYRYGGGEIGPFSGTAILLATLALASLSYSFVERPLRHSRRPALQVFWRQYVLPGGVIAALALFSAVKLDGYGPRYWDDDYRRAFMALSNNVRPTFDYGFLCQERLLSAETLTGDRCVAGRQDAGGRPQVLLWGDSHAAHYAGMAARFAHRGGFGLRTVSVFSCPPLNRDMHGVVKPEQVERCNRSNSLVWSRVGDYAVVVLAANWAQYYLRPGNRFADFLEMTEALVARGKRVILLGQVPLIPGFDRYCQQKSLTLTYLDCRPAPVQVWPDVKIVNARLQQVARAASGIDYYDANYWLCRPEGCDGFDHKGRPLYFDNSHLNMVASLRLGEWVVNHRGLPAAFRQSLNASADSDY